MAYQGGATVYPSKRDAWVMWLLWASVIGMMAAAIAVWVDPAPLGFRVGISALLAGTAVLVVWLVYSTSYSFGRDKLVVRAGPIRWRVKLDLIEEVRPTRNPLSSPALSLDRLHIRYGGSRMGIMISPENKAVFLQDLAVRVDGLEFEGDRVVRRR
jgi:hypothetical protein